MFLGIEALALGASAVLENARGPIDVRVEQSARLKDRLWRELGEAGGQVKSLRQHVGCRHRTVHQTQSMSFCTGDAVAEEKMFLGCGQAGEQRPQHQTPCAVEESEGDPRVAEERVFGHHDEVAEQCHRDACADRRTVDGGNGRKREPSHDPKELLMYVEHRVAQLPIVAHRANGGEVPARAECAALSG